MDALEQMQAFSTENSDNNAMQLLLFPPSLTKIIGAVVKITIHQHQKWWQAVHHMDRWGFILGTNVRWRDIYPIKRTEGAFSLQDAQRFKHP